MIIWSDEMRAKDYGVFCREASKNASKETVIVSDIRRKTDIKWFCESKKILEHLNDKEAQNRKTILAALFILTGDSEYNKQMWKIVKHQMTLTKNRRKQKHKRRTGLVLKIFKINIMNYWIK